MFVDCKTLKFYKQVPKSFDQVARIKKLRKLRGFLQELNVAMNRYLKVTGIKDII